MTPILLPLLKRTADLLVRLSAVRAAKIDNLDLAISAVSPILSVQYGTVTIGAGLSSATATVAAVSSKAVLHLLGVECNSTAATAGLAHVGVRLALTNPTTVTGSRWGSTGTATANFVLVDYK